MFEGKSILQVKSNFLHTTNAIIKNYGREIDKETIMKFRYDKTMEYLKLMEQKLEEGEA